MRPRSIHSGLEVVGFFLFLFINPISMFTLQTIMRVYLSSSKARICLDMNDVYLFETKIEYAHIWFRDDELSAH